MSKLDRSMPALPSASASNVDVTEPGFGGEGSDRLLSCGLDERATVSVVAGPNPGQLFVLDDAEVVIGRDVDAPIHIDDTWVSRRHARIVLTDDGHHVLEDLESRNGVFVGGSRVTRHELRAGDRIQLGPRVLLRFAMLNETEEAVQRDLFESSVRDPLTKAYNRRYLAERLAAEIAHARRHRTALGLVMFDLDEFKNINDTHGHLIGDIVLSEVADHVRTLIRAEDVFARFGGEEFVLLVRGAADPIRLAERIRTIIEDHRIKAPGIDLHVTVSIGVALLGECTLDGDGASLVALADTRLLRAKRAGRNQTCATDG